MDDRVQNTVADVVQPTNNVIHDAGPEAAKQISEPSVFVNAEPIREEQVQNAMKFLSHPKVRGSPVMYRRSFLEKKGLTKEEIDEAFRRVPDPSPSAQATVTTQEGQVRTLSNSQPQAMVQTLQAAAPPVGIASSMGTLTKPQFHWYHAVIAVGVLAASGAGTAVFIKKVMLPRVKSWIRKVVLEEENDPLKKADAKPSLAEEAATAAKSAAAAAADVARASQEMLNARIEEKKYFEGFMNLLGVQVEEMKSMSNAIRNLEGQTANTGRVPLADPEDNRVSGTSPKQPYANGKMAFYPRSGKSSSPPSSAEPAPHPKSYMEIMEMVQRGEKPPNIREINDLPPNPNQQPSNPRLAPRTKPWESNQTQNISSQVIPSQVSEDGLNTKFQNNGVNHSLDRDSSVPWWQRKNPRITEIENDNELIAAPYNGQNQTNERPPPRQWVPPTPPPVVMAEAAEAIRRPKPSGLKEQETESQSASNSNGVTDELQRVTKASESGGAVEINGQGSGLHSTEIEEEQEPGYV